MKWKEMKWGRLFSWSDNHLEWAFGAAADGDFECTSTIPLYLPMWVSIVARIVVFGQRGRKRRRVFEWIWEIKYPRISHRGSRDIMGMLIRLTKMLVPCPFSWISISFSCVFLLANWHRIQMTVLVLSKERERRQTEGQERLIRLWWWWWLDLFSFYYTFDINECPPLSSWCPFMEEIGRGGGG